VIFSAISGAETVQANRRIPSQKLLRNSDDPRENPSERRNGRNATDYSVSETASMSPIILICAVASHHNIMTLRLLDMLDAGRH
jgi:Tat protein secretion system quality control protein TatD with DNase activity